MTEQRSTNQYKTECGWLGYLFRDFIFAHLEKVAVFRRENACLGEKFLSEQVVLLPSSDGFT